MSQSDHKFHTPVNVVSLYYFLWCTLIFSHCLFLCYSVLPMLFILSLSLPMLVISSCIFSLACTTLFILRKLLPTTVDLFLHANHKLWNNIPFNPCNRTQILLKNILVVWWFKISKITNNLKIPETLIHSYFRAVLDLKNHCKITFIW